MNVGRLIEDINNKKDLSEFIQQNAYEEIPSTLEDENQESQRKTTCYEFVNFVIIYLKITVIIIIK